MNSIFNQIKRFEGLQFQEGEAFSFILPGTDIATTTGNGSNSFDTAKDNDFTVPQDKMVVGGKYKVTAKQWMTEPSTPQFDFHDKWNNGKPMPLCIMEGEVLKETPRMYQMSLAGKAEPATYCSVCGRALSNPVSKIYGIGPECSIKIGLERIETEEEARVMWQQIVEKIGNVKWTGWITKSAIKDWKAV